MHDVIIIGGGPAGLFCACSIKESDTSADVLVLEKMDACGRKLLTTGGGQCNITRKANERQLIKGFGRHGKFLGHAIARLTPEATCAWFEQHGLPLTLRDDLKIFPASLDAHDVRDLLVSTCRNIGVVIRNNTPVQAVSYENGIFHVTTEHGVFQSQKLVITTGGMSCPGTGSTGDGYAFAKSLGHTIVPVHPALAAAKVTNIDLSPLEGVSLDMVHIQSDAVSCSGPLLFTRNGVSGPVVLDNSNLLHESPNIKLCLLSKPNGKPLSKEACAIQLKQEAQAHPARNVLTMFHETTQLPQRLCTFLMQAAGLPTDLRTGSLSNAQALSLATMLCSWELSLSFAGAFRTCMATSGGISLDEIDPKTMQSLICPNLYVAGEVLDIDAMCGGYNLQGAWSTAATAAAAIVDGL